MLAEILLVVLAAPAPMPKPPPPRPALAGEWILEWREGSGPCVFDKHGGFSCVWAGRHWIGSWQVREGALHIDEHQPGMHEWDKSGQRLKWSAKLKPTEWVGELEGGGKFRLRKADAK